MSEIAVGIIGGSGLITRMEDLAEINPVALENPLWKNRLDSFFHWKTRKDQGGFSTPPRTRSPHCSLLPLNYRANIFGFKMLGSSGLLSQRGGGSMKESIHPGDMLIPDQFIDRTVARPSTFFSDGIVAPHVSLADPVCPVLSQILYDTGKETRATVHKGGTYLCMEGPQFSTRAESKLYRSWGVDVIGMTNLPEAKLAREAEICYATIAFASDYDCWHEEAADVAIRDVLLHIILARDSKRPKL